MTKGSTMKASVNDNCIGCGMCEGMCPEVFHLNEESHAVAIEGDVPAECESSVEEARDACPVEAISAE